MKSLLNLFKRKPKAEPFVYTAFDTDDTDINIYNGLTKDEARELYNATNILNKIFFRIKDSDKNSWQDREKICSHFNEYLKIKYNIDSLSQLREFSENHNKNEITTQPL